ncbi:unnamed protein product [Mucor circinelloides]|uniref:C2H2-type domain-containing protein n=1 Tax=Mucor circinelloides f. circinelloides (strain 1006PhL) TaxID=1220926 RepID=S2KFB7_MUCC1|nr:hypothetical protein HMPREF1544_02114 [Mucor circinelloides 1006PhL]KAG1091352.1 hypothetical protein G6F42_019453 [Rhizopus arrhizus]
MSPATASALPDPIQPTICYMEAVLPVQLQSVTKMLHFSASAMNPTTTSVKNILPPPFSRSSIRSFSSACSNTGSSPASSSLSSCLTLEDEAVDNEPSSKSSDIPLLPNPAKEDCKLNGIGKQYNCRFCFKKFMRPSSLKIHIYSHTGEKPFKCTHPGCRRKFSVQSNMRRHLRVHSS